MGILSQAHSIHNVCKLLCLALKRRRLRKTAPAPKENKTFLWQRGVGIDLSYITVVIWIESRYVSPY